MPARVLDAAAIQAALEHRARRGAALVYEPVNTTRSVSSGAFDPGVRTSEEHDTVAVGPFRYLVDRDQLHREVHQRLAAWRSGGGAAGWWRTVSFHPSAVDHVVDTAQVDLRGRLPSGNGEPSSTDDVQTVRAAFRSALLSLLQGEVRAIEKGLEFTAVPYLSWRDPDLGRPYSRVTVIRRADTDPAHTTAGPPVADLHLVSPLVTSVRDEPTNLALNEGERSFLNHLAAGWRQAALDHPEHWEGWELHVLRNPAGDYQSELKGASPGAGLATRAGGMFYPDFILWLSRRGPDDDACEQVVLLVDPKGVINSGATDDLIAKIGVHADLAAGVRAPDGVRISVSSFIAARTYANATSEDAVLDTLRRCYQELSPTPTDSLDRSALVETLLRSPYGRAVIMPPKGRGAPRIGRVYQDHLHKHGFSAADSNDPHLYVLAMLYQARADHAASVDAGGSGNDSAQTAA